MPHARLFRNAACGRANAGGAEMNATLTLVDLAGSIALLIWGVHMVQTGITRAFGPQLRRMLSYALGNRFKAFAAGVRVPPPIPNNPPPPPMGTSVLPGGGRGGGAGARAPAP